MTASPKTNATAALCAAMALSFATPSQAAEGWDWLVAPYGWAASIGTDLETRTPPSTASTDTKFGDIVDKIDGAFQIHIEGQGDHFGVLTDFTYLGLADDRDRPRFKMESDLDTRLFELAAVWSPGEDRYRGAELIAGLRYIDVDLTVQLKPANPVFRDVSVEASQSFSDFMIGGRYTWAFTDRWGLTVRGDGSFGETEGTWNASAVVQYRTGNGAWAFGYRHLDAEFDTGNANTDITMSGPEIGYAFRF
ncbi:hypothetical protein M2650_13300 [Luteimonas sp. SX5]|uniref:Outer membrane protein beta-barrel domain-containing protein n=1 Tax=Luteimonas galliterrae TaxID=2940486 RepID=A0ABT0ML34_9GAMM|nr:hypothetical protein [Luteimonas galliterrae]MCL1635598.1 hypothetical protein [Luteimonas galliterrae]